MRHPSCLQDCSVSVWAREGVDRQQVDFEYDGEMAADVALSKEAMALYPLCSLLILPMFHEETTFFHAGFLFDTG